MLIIVIVVLAVFCVVLAVAAVIAGRRRRSRNKSFVNTGEIRPEYHYNLRRSLMTLDENYFYFILRDILPGDFVIVPQMPLTSVVERPSIKSAVSKIDRKIVDYGVFKAIREKKYPYNKLVPVLLIELDDETHTLSDRVDRDMFINGLCSQIGLPILHVQKAERYNERALTRQISALLKRG